MLLLLLSVSHFRRPRYTHLMYTQTHTHTRSAGEHAHTRTDHSHVCLLRVFGINRRRSRVIKYQHVLFEHVWDCDCIDVFRPLCAERIDTDMRRRMCLGLFVNIVHVETPSTNTNAGDGFVICRTIVYGLRFHFPFELTY